MSILLAVASVALLTFTGSCLYVGRAVLLRMNQPSKSDPDLATTDDLTMMASRFHAEIESLRFAIAEGIERTTRAEQRISKTVSGTRRLLRESGLEDPKLEAEAAQLHDRNDPGSGERELPAVPASVAPTRSIRFPGGSVDIGAA